MRDEVIVFIALVIAGIVGFLLYKRRVGGMSRKQRFIDNAKREGNYTTGEYVDSKVQLGSPDSADLYLRSNTLKVRYMYHVDGIPYYKTLTFQDPGKVKHTLSKKYCHQCYEGAIIKI